MTDEPTSEETIETKSQTDILMDLLLLLSPLPSKDRIKLLDIAKIFFGGSTR